MLGCWSRRIRHFVGKYSAGLPKLLSMFPWKHFEKNFFLDYLVHRSILKTKKFSERYMIFSNCSDFELQICRFLSTIFCGVFKAASYVFIATYWRKILFWIFLFFKNYRKLGKKTFALVPNKIRKGCQNSITFVHRTNLTKKNSVKKFGLSITFGLWVWSLQPFVDYFCGVFKGAFYVSIGSFRRKLLFRYFFVFFTITKIE